jgi:hypothetical protein
MRKINVTIYLSEDISKAESEDLIERIEFSENSLIEFIEEL